MYIHISLVVCMCSWIICIIRCYEMLSVTIIAVWYDLNQVGNGMGMNTHTWFLTKIMHDKYCGIFRVFKHTRSVIPACFRCLIQAAANGAHAPATPAHTVQGCAHVNGHGYNFFVISNSCVHVHTIPSVFKLQIICFVASDGFATPVLLHSRVHYTVNLNVLAVVDE